ncbi:MAG: penicillin acylase family protein [Nitrospirae bacterium]|nr:penicillin acylase family protein [Nitrospirota bacterium]
MRLTILTLLTLVVASCAAASLIGYRLWPDYPRPQNETLAFEGLGSPVHVFLDAAGIPHIEAATEKDLLFAVGFMHGRDRFFEMDVMRRVARGRLSELVGEQPFMSGTTVEYDRSMRGWGFERAAREDEVALDAEMKDWMETYARGVNTARTRYRPLEYRLLGVEPEPWTVLDSFALGRLNSWTVTHNWHQEASRLVLALHVGIERAERIHPSEPWRGAFSLPVDRPPRELPPAVAPELRDLFPERPPSASKAQERERASWGPIFPVPSAASNAWAVGGGRSTSGKPLVASDPHLIHLLPSLMYQQHLKCPGIDVIGGTIPGLPYVLFGHNETVAWGITSTVGDAIDLYIERAHPDQPGLVLTPKGYEPLAEEELIVRVRKDLGFEERRFALRRSRHGPLLNDVYPGLLPEWAPLVAIRQYDGPAVDSLRSLRAANRARTVRELRTALFDMTGPVQTWTAADVGGEVALFVMGRVPVRTRHRGTFPVPGWVSDYDWTTYINPSNMPHAFGSGEASFAHANNLTEDPRRGSAFIQVDSAPSYRVERIAQMLGARERHDRESFARMQQDVRLGRADRLLPYVLSDLRGGADWSHTEAEAISILEHWDGAARGDAPAPAIFFAAYREAVLAALGDEVDRAGVEFILAQRYSTNIYDQWIEEVDHPVWDDRTTARTERRPEVIRSAFRKAVAALEDEQGSDPGKWRWGRLHDMHVKHMFGSKRFLAGLVNIPPHEAGGALDSVWKSHFDLGHPNTPFRSIAGPIYRMVIDLADPRHAQWVIDTGSSGWPASPHYADQHELWREGRYLPMVSDWDEIRRDAAATLGLQPATGAR